MSTPEPEQKLSRDARNSTYAPATDVEERNPPDGPQVVQELGLPSSVTPKTSTKASSSSGSS